jgi:signal peptidase I
VNRLKVFETAFLVVGVLSATVAIQAWAVKPFEIPSRSMEPTLSVDQRVLVDRLTSNLGSDPDIGDVVVFHPPLSATPDEQAPGSNVPECGAPHPGDLRSPCSEPIEERAEQYFIKRVVAGPGDRLTIDQGVPVANGERVEGNWETIPCDPGACTFPGAITIPDDHYFLMGDNRPGSSDSRFWGPVPRDWIIGVAFATYWPPEKVGGL